MPESSTYRVQVLVRDADGKPVAEAAVAVVQFSLPAIPPSTTDAEGAALLEVPEDAQVFNVMALKPQIGLDYFENYSAWPPGRALPRLPPEVHLVLGRAVEIRVQVVDSADRPVGGVPLTPWTIKRAGKLNYVNCSAGQTTTVQTDAAGVASFDWIPADLDNDAQFLVCDRKYHCPFAPWIDLAHPDRLLTARLFRTATVAGRVAFPDGSPAGGIAVQAEGRGRTNFYCRAEVKSGPDGMYEFLLWPGQSYIIAVADDAWAARSLYGLVVQEGQARAGLDLHLTKGTQFHGRVTLGPDRRPAAGQTITFTEQGGALEDTLRGYFSKAELVRWAKTNGEGCYEIRLGPGQYELCGPTPGVREEIVLGAEEEVARDFHLPWLGRGPFTGEVRRAGALAEPVPRAVVRAVSVVRGHAGFETACDSEGRFSCERWRDPMVVYARNQTGAEAGCCEIGEEDESAAVAVSLAGTVHGRVVDATGVPRGKERVVCRMRVNMRDGNPVTFQIETRTDDAGAFTLPGILLDASCDVAVLRGYRPVTDWHAFTVSQAGVTALPDTVLEGPGA